MRDMEFWMSLSSRGFGGTDNGMWEDFGLSGKAGSVLLVELDLAELASEIAATAMASGG
jgi:hypothetical protein